METPVLLAVLCGAFLHAAWNVIVKGADDHEVDVALVHFLSAVAALPLLLWYGLPPPQAWPYILLSLSIHVAYYITLTGAYQHGELGTTYPIMRGTAPLLVAISSWLIFSEPLSLAGWAGVVAVTVGVLLVGLAHPGQALHQGRALGFALGNAAVIACYTLVDGAGVRLTAQTGHAIASYVLVLFVLDGVPYPALVMWRRGRTGWPQVRALVQQRWGRALLGGLASLGSYGIALWAMTRAPLALVSALRETSVLFGAVMSVLILKERFGPQRLIGAAVIVAGVVALRVG